MRRALLALALLLARQLPAHVGSPDVFYEGAAGPYRLLVTIRPPVIVPGVAEIEIRSATPGVAAMRIVPLPLTGAGAKFAPDRRHRAAHRRKIRNSSPARSG